MNQGTGDTRVIGLFLQANVSEYRTEFPLFGTLRHVGAKNITKVALKRPVPAGAAPFDAAAATAELLQVRTTINAMLATHLGEQISRLVPDPAELYSQGSGSCIVEFADAQTAQRIVRLLSSYSEVPFHKGGGKLQVRVDHSARVAVPAIVSGAIRVGFQRRVLEIQRHFAQAGQLLWMKWDLAKNGAGVITQASFVIDAYRGE